MNNYTVGEVVWIKPLARRGIICAIVGHSYRIGNGLWGAKHMQTIDERQQYLIQYAIDKRRIAHKNAITRLALVFSEPLECTFHTHAAYRRAYLDWANSFGLDAMPSWVRRRYLQYLLTPEAAR